MRIYLITILVFILVACGNDELVVNLDHQIASESEPVFTLGYPESWVAQPSGESVHITNSLFLLTTDDPAAIVFNKGQYWLTASIQPAFEVDTLTAAMPEGTTGAQTLIALFMTTLTDESDPRLGQARNFEVNGLEGVMVTGTIASGSRATGVLVAALEIEGYYAVFMGVSHSDEVKQLEDFVKPIIGSLVIDDDGL